MNKYEQDIFILIKSLFEEIKNMHPADGLSSPRDMELTKEINKKTAQMDYLQMAMRVYIPDFEIREGN